MTMQKANKKYKMFHDLEHISIISFSFTSFKKEGCFGIKTKYKHN